MSHILLFMNDVNKPYINALPKCLNTKTENKENLYIILDECLKITKNLEKIYIFISSDIYFSYSKILKKKYGPLIEFIFIQSNIYDISHHVQLFLNKIILSDDSKIILLNANTMPISDVFLFDNISIYPSLIKYSTYQLVTNENDIQKHCQKNDDIGMYFFLYSQLATFFLTE